MKERINDFLEVSSGDTITSNRDIEMIDIEGNRKVVCKCYGTIVSGRSLSFFIEVVEEEVYFRYKDKIQQQINIYVSGVKDTAIANNVPFVGV